MKVLLSAFSCAPGLGSEPGVGWGVVKAAASRHRVWVLTSAGSRPWIEKQPPLPQAEFVYVDLPRVARALAGPPGLHQIYYALWQAAAAATARRLHDVVRFDLAHHVTYVTPWVPTWLGRLGIPFIWNAGCIDRVPAEFLREMGWRSRVGEVLRAAAHAIGGRLAAHVARASLTLTASDPRLWPRRRRVVQFPMGGWDGGEAAAWPASNRLRVISVGRLLGLKGFALGVRAFARLRREFPDCEYAIVGDGPERGRLARMAEAMGCGTSIKFHGWRPREEAMRRMAESDVLVHPSLHEQFGYVILEAMSLGRPVICLRAGGPANVMDDACGRLIDAGSPDQVVCDIHAALRSFATDRAALEACGRRARERALAHYTWERVGERLLRLYDEAVETRA